MKLKPCPFCGGTAEFAEHEDKQYVECTSCLASSQAMRSEKGDVDRLLAEVWNQRAGRAAVLPHDRNGHTVLPGDKFTASCGHVLTVRPYDAFGFCDVPGCFDMHFQMAVRRWAADGVFFEACGFVPQKHDAMDEIKSVLERY